MPCGPGQSALCQARRQLRPQALRELIPYSARLCRHAKHRSARIPGAGARFDGTESAEKYRNVQPISAACSPQRRIPGRWRAPRRCSMWRGTFVDAVLGGLHAGRSLAGGPASATPQQRGICWRSWIAAIPRDWLSPLVERQVSFCARMPEHWRQVKTFCAVPPTMRVSLLALCQSARLTLRLLRLSARAPAWCW